MERKQLKIPLLMAKEAVREGITYDHCHSHHKNNQYNNEKTYILEKVSRFKSTLFRMKEFLLRFYLGKKSVFMEKSLKIILLGENTPFS